MKRKETKPWGFKTSNTERWASESLAGVWGMSVCEDSLKASSGSRQTCWGLLLLPCSQIQSGSQEWVFMKHVSYGVKSALHPHLGPVTEVPEFVRKPLLSKLAARKADRHPG